MMLRKLTNTFVMIATAGFALVAQAQMVQSPLLSKTTGVPPNIVFMFDDSSSMAGDALYQYGGFAGVWGMSGPGTPTNASLNTAGSLYNSSAYRSPDVNLIYYDPRVSYSPRINADGSFQTVTTLPNTTSFQVFFYKPPVTTIYSVAGVTVGASGSGYPANGSAVQAKFNTPPAGGTQATATATTSASTTVNSVTVNSFGTGYPASGVTVSFTPPPAGGVIATGAVNMGTSSKISGVTVNSLGAGFPGSGVTGVFSAPSSTGGVQATGTVSIGSSPNITSVTVSAHGTGFPATGKTVTFSAPATTGGVRATGTVTTATYLSVGSVTINTAGANYASTVGVTFSAPPAGGVQATGTVTRTSSASGRGIASINITAAGSGYTAASPPVATLTNVGSGAGATFTVNTSSSVGIASINITNSGSGYTGTPTLTLGGTAGGSGQTLAIVTGTTNVISGVSVTNAGSGYAASSPPVFTLNAATTGTGTGAAFTPVLATTNIISSITVTNPGSGYSSVPTLTLGNVSSGTGASLTVNGGTTYGISAITVTNPGSGYLATPVLTLTSTGTGAATTVSTSSTVTASINATWNGVGAATTYFTPQYTPDAGSTMAAGATLIAYPNTASSTTTTYPKFKARTDCGAASTSCTWAQELQNYTIWKTFHSTRLDMAKTGVGLAFQPLAPSFRLGYATINNDLNRGTAAPGPPVGNRVAAGVQTYDTTTQSAFFTWLYGINTLIGATPNRTALDRVGNYFKRNDDAGPWSDTPGSGRQSTLVAGTANASHASCRRNYAVLMTDGYYNDSTFTIADADTTGKTNEAGEVYTATGPYSDTSTGTATANTFADVAMKYWFNSLRPDFADQKGLKSKVTDAATWPHMNFYAIGLGVIGTLDATDPQVRTNLTSPGRTLDWPAPASNSPSAIDDMWHATINGRGSMLNARTADELRKSFKSIVSDVLGTEDTQSGVAVSAVTLTSTTKKYTPKYTPTSWIGNVQAFNLDGTTGDEKGVAWEVEKLVSTDPITGAQTFLSLIPSDNPGATPPTLRNVYVGNGATSGTRAIPFNYAAMNATSPPLTSAMNGTVNANLINYLRGDSSNEDIPANAANASAVYRGRSTRLGDIVNSTPTFVKDTLDLKLDNVPGPSVTYASFRSAKKARTEGMLFVGANDGMLHGFRDGTVDANGGVVQAGGIETFAYVPSAILPSLNQLADKSYVHKYYVDGPNIETDAYFNTANRWANIVLGSTGAGAGTAGVPGTPTGTSPRTAVFAIDTTSLNTNVTSMNASSVLWEVSSNLPAFDELGYVLTDIQAGPTLDGSWVALFGNGYESKSCSAQLFIVNIETGALIKKIDTNSGNNCATKNGLGGLRLVRNDKQQIIGVYAGDLLGNMWKFSLNSASQANWRVDLGGDPLYKATTTSPALNQPITAPPTVVSLSAASTPTPGYMVVFGTGKFYESNDLTSTSQQSLFGVWDASLFGADNSAAGSPRVNQSQLVQQQINATTTVVNGVTYFSSTNNAIDYVNKKGWYLNFPNSGQRLIYPMDLLAGRFVAVDSIAPTSASTDPCVQGTGGTGYFYILDALSGARPAADVLTVPNVNGYKTSIDGRNVSILKQYDPSVQTTYVNVSGSSSKGTLFTIPCKLTNTCTTTSPVKNIKSRVWRQLFVR